MGVVGLADFAPLLPNLYQKCIAATILCVFIGYAIFVREKTVYRFKPGSKQLIGFFRDWYNIPGDLSVYCDDLDWARSDEIHSALVNKASKGQLRLFLKIIGSQGQQLRASGASVFQIPSCVQSQHKFSILKNDGFEQIICRSKVTGAAIAGPELIEFIGTCSTNDPHLIALANDVLSYSIILHEEIPKTF